MWENFSKPEYQHLLLNHLPLIGLGVAILVLLGTALLRQRRAVIFSLFLVSLCAGSIWPVMKTGERAEHRVKSMLYNEDQPWLQHHEALAERWVWVYLLTAGVALISAILVWFRPKWTKCAVGLVLLLAVASLLAGALIAEAGGKIMHSEFRTESVPVEVEHSGR